MSETEPPKVKQGQVAAGFAMVFFIGGFIIFQVAIAPAVFGDPAEHGYSFTRTLCAGLTGGGSSLIGYGVGKLVEKLQR